MYLDRRCDDNNVNWEILSSDDINVCHDNNVVAIYNNNLSKLRYHDINEMIQCRCDDEVEPLSE